MKNETRILDDFLLGKMNEQEKLAFETRLATEPALKEELEIQEAVLHGIDRAALKQEIQMTFKSINRQRNRWRWGGIAGLIVISATLFFALSNKNKDEVNYRRSETLAMHHANQTQISASGKNESAVLNNIVEVKKNSSEMLGVKKKSFATSNIQKRRDSVSLVNSMTAEVKQDMGPLVLFKNFQLPFSQFRINPLRDTNLVLTKKGTVLHVPALSIVDRNGNAVKEIVDISYREYTNSAEIAFSGIPMNYKEKGEEYYFNSSGMFELEGSSKGEEVFIKQGAKVEVDYALAKQNPDIDFYYLDKKTNEWVKKQDILNNKELKEKELLAVKKDEVVQKKRGINWLHFFMGIGAGKNGDFEVQDTTAYFHNKVKKPVTHRDTIRLRKKYGDDWEKIFRHQAVNGIKENPVAGVEGNHLIIEKDEFPEVKNDKRSATLLGGGDPGHSYPPIVKRLNVGDFGVYNCDQIYRIGNHVQVRATFKNESGEVIKSTKVLSMVDLNYNGAFSFDPGSFYFNPKNPTVLLLFTNNGKLYSIDKETLKSMNITKGGAYEIIMKDVSATIKSTADLKLYLGLK